jgi:hypothetical protein
MATTGDAAAYVRASTDPYVGWMALLERYDNKDGNDLKNLYKKWDDVMNEGPGVKDPKLWFLKLEEKENDIVLAGGKKKDESELVSLLETTMANMREYEQVIDMIGMQEKRDNLEFWKKQLFDHWKRKLKNLHMKKDENDAAYFVEKGKIENQGPPRKPFAKKGYKPFKGACHNCGKPGHKAFQCTAPRSIQNNADNRKCFHCNERGHISKNCPQRNKRQDTPEIAFVGVTWNGTPEKSKCEVGGKLWDENKNVKFCSPCQSPIITTSSFLHQFQNKSWYDICEEESDNEI